MNAPFCILLQIFSVSPFTLHVTCFKKPSIQFLSRHLQRHLIYEQAGRPRKADDMVSYIETPIVTASGVRSNRFREDEDTSLENLNSSHSFMKDA